MQSNRITLTHQHDGKTRKHTKQCTTKQTQNLTMGSAINNESTTEILYWNRQKPMPLALLGKASQ